MLPCRTRALSGRLRPPHRRSGAVRPSPRPPNGRSCSRPFRHRLPDAPGKARLAGISPRAPPGARAGARARGHRSRRTLGLLRRRRRRLRVDRRAARTAPRRFADPGRPGAHDAGRHDRRGAASGNDLAVVEQGHRHRPPLRPRQGVAHRARRGVVDRPFRRRPLQDPAIARRLGPAPRPHDAMRDPGPCIPSGRIRTGSRAESDLPRRNASFPLDDPTRRRSARRPGRGEHLPRPCLDLRGDRLPARPAPRARPGPDRCGADDVRAGELRALPPQDLQRDVDDRRRKAGALPVRDDSAHAGVQSGRGVVRISRQRGGHARARGELVRPGPAHGALLCRAGAHRDPDEGGDPQPPDRDLTLSGRRDRRGRRDPRRGGDGPRSPRQGRHHRVLGLEPAHPGLRPALGARAPQTGPRRFRAGDHARRPDRRRRVQQRVRAPCPWWILPDPGDRRREDRRGGGAWRRGRCTREGIRLPQARHDRGRGRQHPRRPDPEDRLRAGRSPPRARRPGDAHRPRRRRRILEPVGER